MNEEAACSASCSTAFISPETCDTGDSSPKKRKIDPERVVTEIRCVADKLIALEEELSHELRSLSFYKSKVGSVYNPLEYAKIPHDVYVRKYGDSLKSLLLLGMNPGPFGMAQTGVPFGDVAFVRDWLKVTGDVAQPTGGAHPKRPITGFGCTRSEVSGTRLWGLLRSLCKDDDPSSFFGHCFIHNYCPVVLMETGGRNVTPPSLSNRGEREALEALCDASLAAVLALLRPDVVVGVGKYAAERTRRVVAAEERLRGTAVETLLHPSPINPAANRPPGWAHKAEKQLRALRIGDHMALANP